MKMKLTFENWTIKNKHALRGLYSDFLKETGCSLKEWKAGKVASYSQFQSAMWKNCKGSK